MKTIASFQMLTEINQTSLMIETVLCLSVRCWDTSTREITDLEVLPYFCCYKTEFFSFITIPKI